MVRSSLLKKLIPLEFHVAFRWQNDIGVLSILSVNTEYNSPLAIPMNGHSALVSLSGCNRKPYHLSHIFFSLRLSERDFEFILLLVGWIGRVTAELHKLVGGFKGFMLHNSGRNYW